MKFSFKKNDEEFFTILEQEQESTSENSAVNNKKVSHSALTPDEVISGFSTNNKSNVKDTGALDMLKKRIAAAAEQKASPNNKTEAEIKPAPIPDTAAEINEIKPESKPLDNTEIKAEEKNKYEEKPQNTQATKPMPSLLDKCMPFITDEDGNKTDLNSIPLYKLESVAEILKSDSEKALERLSEKYDIAFDDLGHTPKHITPQRPDPVPEAKPEPKPAVVQKDIFEEKLPIKNVQSNVKSIISDIDAPPKEINYNGSENISNTATITFTPINDGKNGSSHLNISSKTRPIDLTGELEKLPDVGSEQEESIQLEKNEFEDFVPHEEFSDQKDAGKFIRKFSIKKRNAFLIAVSSIILTVILSVAKLPFMNQLILSHTKVIMLICSAITGIIVILNGKMFASLKNILNRRSVPDVCASLASLTTAVYAVFGILKDSIITDVLLLLSIILSFRSLTAFFKASYMLSNFKQISGNNKKNAVRLINDTAVTFAMAKNAIDGDVLIAAPQKSDHINDYMKYSSFSIFFGGKLPVLTILSVILSVILGFTCASYFDGIVYGFYAASAIQCLTALPVAFFIDILPLHRAAKKLNKKGGMIAGKTAADYIEMANAVVVNSADLFPSGMVTLHQMKVLSDNNLEDTIIRAASLTESLNSSLAPIFKKIAGTGNITVLPDSDTVKYEDRMGISGWVDNRLLFIGNRTLMEAHGIEVPPVEIDRKILRKGYFPVYVATRDKACALLVIQYNVDREIAHELRKLTASGVTLLVDSCDPNLIEEMICDYFGLYSDSVKVMSAAGCHMYKNAVSTLKSVSAPAAFKGNPLTLASIVNCASKIKKSNTLLTIMYIISLVLGTVIFAYTSLSGSGTLLSETALLLYGLLSTVASYIIYFFSRP